METYPLEKIKSFNIPSLNGTTINTEINKSRENISNNLDLLDFLSLSHPRLKRVFSYDNKLVMGKYKENLSQTNRKDNPFFTLNKNKPLLKLKDEVLKFNKSHNKGKIKKAISKKKISLLPIHQYIHTKNNSSNNKMNIEKIEPKVKMIENNFFLTNLNDPIGKSYPPTSSIFIRGKTSYTKKSLEQIQREFSKDKFQEKFDDFNNKIKDNRSLHNYFSHKYINAPKFSSRLNHDNSPFKDKLKSSILLSEDFKKLNPKFYSSILNKKLGQVTIADKYNVDIMNFGEKYIRLNDVDFLKRAHDIVKFYQKIRISANLDVEKQDLSKIILMRDRFKKSRIQIFKKCDKIELEKMKADKLIEKYIINKNEKK